MSEKTSHCGASPNLRTEEGTTASQQTAFSTSTVSVFPSTHSFSDSQSRHVDRYAPRAYDVSSAIPKADDLTEPLDGSDYKLAQSRGVDNMTALPHHLPFPPEGNSTPACDVSRHSQRVPSDGYDPTFISSVPFSRHKKRPEILCFPPREGLAGSMVSMTVRIENDQSVGQSWILSIGGYQCDVFIANLSCDDNWRVVSVRFVVPIAQTSGLKFNQQVPLILSVDSEVLNVTTFSIIEPKHESATKRKYCSQDEPSPKRHQTRISDGSFVGYNTPKTPSIASFPFPLGTSDESSHIIPAHSYVPTRPFHSQITTVSSNHMAESSSGSVPGPITSAAPATVPVSRSVSGTQAMAMARPGYSSSNTNGHADMSYPYGTNKVVLTLANDPEDVVRSWEESSRQGSRCLVKCLRGQQGSNISASFELLDSSEPATKGTISCIWWEERQSSYVTSVDVISLLEFLVYGPDGQSFTIEEKNRIRRNMENLRPLTISKSKSDLKPFFELIMSFPPPKPRNIEKDIKVFPWSSLKEALKKVFGKYSMVNSSVVRSSVDASSHQAISHPCPPVPLGTHDSKYGISRHPDFEQKPYSSVIPFPVHSVSRPSPSSLYDTSQPSSANAYYPRSHVTDWQYPHSSLGLVSASTHGGPYLPDSRQMLPPPGNLHSQSTGWDMNSQYGYLNSGPAPPDAHRLSHSSSPSLPLGLVGAGSHPSSRTNTNSHSPIPGAAAVVQDVHSSIYSPPSSSSLAFAHATSLSHAQGQEGDSCPPNGNLPAPSSGYYSARALSYSHQPLPQPASGYSHSHYDSALNAGYGPSVPAAPIAYHPSPATVQVPQRRM